MRMYIPVTDPRFRDRPAFHSLDTRTQEKLVRVMESVYSEEAGLAELRSDFAFRNSALLGQWDLARGETGFMMEYQLDKALLELGFAPHSTIGLELQDLLPDIDPMRGQSTVYQHGKVIGIVTTEAADRGRHKFFDVRFGALDSRIAY